jgi:hypothetical protein
MVISLSTIKLKDGQLDDLEVIMEDLSAVDIGATGVIIIMALRMLFELLKEIYAKKSKAAPQVEKDNQLSELLDGQEEIQKDINNILDLVQDLHDWHKREDPDHLGAKIWWSLDTKDLLELAQDLKCKEKDLHSKVNKLLEIARDARDDGKDI